MSHIPLRKEKNCLNCGTTVDERYCPRCGQENIVPKETFWHMVTHFFYDITHFDSSFFHSLRHLIFRPGFLTKEYMAGRRASYLHPIRMYVFSSAMFFLLFFSVFKINPLATDINMPITTPERQEYIRRLQSMLVKDSGNVELKYHLAMARDSSKTITKKDMLATGEGGFMITFADVNYKTRAEYDSVQNSLPEEDRDSWIERRLVHKQIDINQRFKENPDEASEQFVKSILHRLPYMLFISLPLFALILNLVYVRRKQFYYADHGVFTIHLYIFSFIVLILVFGFNKLEELTGLGIWGNLTILLFLWLFAYLLFAMKRFYGQKWGKTILKYLIVTILSLLMMLVLLVLFMFFSAVTF